MPTESVCLIHTNGKAVCSGCSGGRWRAVRAERDRLRETILRLINKCEQGSGNPEHNLNCESCCPRRVGGGEKVTPEEIVTKTIEDAGGHRTKVTNAHWAAAIRFGQELQSKTLLALRYQVENEGCEGAPIGEKSYKCDGIRLCGLCRLRNERDALRIQREKLKDALVSYMDDISMHGLPKSEDAGAFMLLNRTEYEQATRHACDTLKDLKCGK